jgi:hypothetical protein
MSREIDAATSKVMPKVVEWRRYIHQHPELSNREVNTAKFVADELAEARDRGAYRYREDRRCRHPERRGTRPGDRASELTWTRFR